MTDRADWPVRLEYRSWKAEIHPSDPQIWLIAIESRGERMVYEVVGSLEYASGFAAGVMTSMNKRTP
jgi:hypothetical protein